ncbi:FAD-binding protein [Pseudactinotalea sp. Z1732]|uniref:FAD-binding protein n=1 Tax=Micrococcales TaxID=85006 RepID=UPI003C7E3F0B
MSAHTGPGINWAGSHVFGARTLHRPTSLDQARRIIAAAPRIRALGTRHSFNALPDSPGDLISLAGLEPQIEIDERAGTVTVSAAVTYGDLAEALDRAGFALHAMASLPHISVAGAIATGTHGSGDGVRSLAAAVVGLEFIDAQGQVHRIARGEPDFEGAVVSLGALGVTTRVTMRIEPAYRVRQWVFNDVPWDLVLEDFDALTALGTSVSLFPSWRADSVDSVWVKRRTDGPDGGASPGVLGAYAAPADQHPVRSADARVCTPQQGVAGPWHERLPHFRMGFTPSSGAEIQVEYALPRDLAIPALDALRGSSTLRERVGPLLHISEVRTIAADDLWLSPAYRRRSISVHFTMGMDPEPVAAVLPVIDEVLAPFEARPHWAKWFRTDPLRLARRYPMLGRFRDLAARCDPHGCFRNEFLDTWVFGGTGAGR